MFVNGSGRKEQSVLMNFHRCILPNFGSLDKALSDEKISEIDQLSRKHPWKILYNDCSFRPESVANRLKLATLKSTTGRR
jgi:hypothetical protein